jgi:Zn-dependent peptidase ImmA (M78 family)
MKKKRNGKKPMINKIDELIVDILELYKESVPPINPFHIITEENIRLELLPSVKNRFGRIEYLKDPGVFIIYCSSLLEDDDSVARFSVCHELGHYYLEEHRKLLLNGQFHVSNSGFKSDSILEKEADEFAGKLLIPPLYLKKFVGSKTLIGLEEIKRLSNTCQVSLTSASIRYVKSDIEPCAIIISENNIIKYYFPSDSAAVRGFGGLGKKEVPLGSATSEALKMGYDGKIHKAQSSIKEWYSNLRRHAELWEEAFVLGKTGMVLTLLYLKFNAA